MLTKEEVNEIALTIIQNSPNPRNIRNQSDQTIINILRQAPRTPAVNKLLSLYEEAELYA